MMVLMKRLWNALVSLGVLAAAALVGCDKKDPGGPGSGGQAAIASGKLSDASGGALSGVTILLNGFPKGAGDPIHRYVGQWGYVKEYSIPLPEGMYNAPRAIIGIGYHDRWYELPLADVEGLVEWPHMRDSKDGLRRDFTWKISGPKPGGDPNSPEGYWGGSIYFDKGGDLGDVANIEITLRPDGPLIDGSAGEVIVRKVKLPWKRPYDHYLFDIPLGRYIASAKVLYGKNPKPLRLVSYTVDPNDPEASQESRKPLNTTLVEFEPLEGKNGEVKLGVPTLVAFPPPDR